MRNKKLKRGFTLLELLIVIGIIAILAVILVIVLNPAETLRKARDSQRMSDLSTLKTALGIYITSTSTPYLAGTDNTACKTGSAGGSYSSGDKIYYSLVSTSAITDMSIDGGAGGVPLASQVGSVNLTLTDGTGWLPVNFDVLTSGSPISNLPIDPMNTIADLNAVASTDLVYRYACNATNLTFEINAQLESDAYTLTDDRRKKDGGNNSNFYEVGTNLKILGTGADF
ncbi:MAG: type II secretion system protein [Candidatus Terrybacteria bacterium]|nr:type II secretion system protein [Candidatus Terrybacteria bacterium]